MNTYLVVAAAMAFIVGLVHSVFGEKWVFARMRQQGCIPTRIGTRARHPGWVGLLGIAVCAWLGAA